MRPVYAYRRGLEPSAPRRYVRDRTEGAPLNSRQTTEPGLERVRTLGSDAVFREVNSRIVELGERFGFRDERRLELLCECGDCSCAERVDIERTVYEQVRAAPGRRVVAARHDLSARTISVCGGYVVVDD